MEEIFKLLDEIEVLEEVIKLGNKNKINDYIELNERLNELLQERIDDLNENYDLNITREAFKIVRKFEKQDKQ
ncbi:hypothetical protein SDC9_48148 [bioreactor metagenome]|uniref:Uncharacterized protein n=1 Tax=bioreactor metagenome TaxID=1076179 RepID=A0A644WEI6_9ZZZZ